MTVEAVNETQDDGTVIKTRNVRKPILKKTFALKRIGYKVIPYEDESDSRYSFITENIVFVNKANPTYRAEATRGDEFLMRHVISIVAEAVAQAKHDRLRQFFVFPIETTKSNLDSDVHRIWRLQNSCQGRQ
jgi:hypothetical protein